jgi:hypothetical protein
MNMTQAGEWELLMLGITRMFYLIPFVITADHY